MHDIILNKTRKKLNSAHYHFLFWAVFIVYEISLAAAIRQGFNHILDYALHYLLNIALFYVHCYLVLGDKKIRNFSDFRNLLLNIVLLFIAYYLLSIGINKALVSAGIPVNVPEHDSRLFRLATLYRCVYIIGLSTALRFAINLLENRQQMNAYITRNLIAEKEKSQLMSELSSARLSFLRSQLNPHFILNCLNGIYNRIRKKDRGIAEYVMAMSELTQYALASPAAEDEVSLDMEIRHISNYIVLQEMRYAPYIEFRNTVHESDLKILPLILITFIENIFQHGELHQPRRPVLIELSTYQGELTLLTQNAVRIPRRPGRGLGISTSLKCLQLYYPGRHSLQYGEQDGIFNLRLTLKLK